jgi:hypothetical protein
LAARRRRRALVKIRGEFARCGYPLDRVADAEIEASLPPGTCDSPPDYLGAKTISRAVSKLRDRTGGAYENGMNSTRFSRSSGSKVLAMSSKSSTHLPT